MPQRPQERPPRSSPAGGPAPGRRLDALPLAAGAAQIAAMAVAERLVQMSAPELRELGRRLQERLAAEA